MRGTNNQQDELFCTISIDQLIPEDHPLRRIRVMADSALRRMEPQFEKLYSGMGRPGIAPERLLRALLLQVLYGYRSERRLMTELRYNFALRWFVGLTMGEALWDVTVFTKNRDRFLAANVAQQWLEAIVLEAREQKLLDEDHFSVDGTLIQAWASPRSYQPKRNPPTRGSGWHGKMLRRDLYESKTDPEARVFRKNFLQPWMLCYTGHLLTDNRHGLIVGSEVTLASKTSERTSGVRLLQRIRTVLRKRKMLTVGADKAYHERDFVDGARQIGVEPHINAYRSGPHADLIGEETRTTFAYQDSMRKRKWIERCFGWLKEPGRQRRTRFRGQHRVDWSFTFAAGVYNLLRMVRIQALA